MRTVTGQIVKGLQVGSHLSCADNSGAKELQIVGVKHGGGVRRRKQRAGIADMVFVRVKKGDKKLRGELHKAVIVRQRKEYYRPEGITIRFEDNAAVLVDDMDMPKGNKIKGAIAKEAVERWPLIGKVASIIV